MIAAKHSIIGKQGRTAGRETGAVLIISLLILLAMTLIGVSSMDSAVMELRMSNIMQQQVVALNRAEATLRAAEEQIEIIATDGTTYDFEASGDGYYPVVNTLTLEQADWGSASTEAGPVDSDNGVDDDDQYITEYLGMKTPADGSQKYTGDPIAGSTAYTFRNTIRSASGRSVVRIVQSIYVTLEAP